LAKIKQVPDVDIVSFWINQYIPTNDKSSDLQGKILPSLHFTSNIENGIQVSEMHICVFLKLHSS